ncbi:MAG: hypothetical protein LUH03_04825 [Oscillospiraceae bacterium]|nr:hypothetical protein [Oscillospiraceae bacterium]
MKRTLNSILAVILALVMTASVVASEITVTTELPPENDTKITINKDEEKKPNCSPHYDESWLDVERNDY